MIRREMYVWIHSLFIEHLLCAKGCGLGLAVNSLSDLEQDSSILEVSDFLSYLLRRLRYLGRNVQQSEEKVPREIICLMKKSSKIIDTSHFHWLGTWSSHSLFIINVKNHPTSSMEAMSCHTHVVTETLISSQCYWPSLWEVLKKS